MTQLDKRLMPRAVAARVAAASRAFVRAFGWPDDGQLTGGAEVELAVGREQLRVMERDRRRAEEESAERFRLNQRIEISGTRGDGSEFPLELAVAAFFPDGTSK
jgi:hypothetical protein